jgi:hypothetical protein
LGRPTPRHFGLRLYFESGAIGGSCIPQAVDLP